MVVFLELINARIQSKTRSKNYPVRSVWVPSDGRTVVLLDLSQTYRTIRHETIIEALFTSLGWYYVGAGTWPIFRINGTIGDVITNQILLLVTTKP